MFVQRVYKNIKGIKVSMYQKTYLPATWLTICTTESPITRLENTYNTYIYIYMSK